jgi:hypothetical protein
VKKVSLQLKSGFFCDSFEGLKFASAGWVLSGIFSVAPPMFSAIIKAFA